MVKQQDFVTDANATATSYPCKIHYGLAEKQCRPDPALTGEKGDGLSALNEVSWCLSTSDL